jgi:O-antigen ligase
MIPSSPSNFPSSDDTVRTPDWVFVELLIFSLLAIAAPVLLSYTRTPTVTFYNQIVALVGWGVWLSWMSHESKQQVMADQAVYRAKKIGISAGAMLMALGLSMAWQSKGLLQWPLGGSLTLQGLAMTAAAMLAFLSGFRVSRQAEHKKLIFEVFCWALVAAAFASAALALIQVFMPKWADGRWIATPLVAGRAVGNLRQPNHLSTLLLMGAAAWVSLPKLRSGWGFIGLTLLVWGVVATGSRTGMVGVGLLALWGIFDKNLSKGWRWFLVLTPGVYALCWEGMAQWATASGHSFIGEARLHSGSDISSSRFDIWRDTLQLIQQNIWQGVGWDEFNFAWTLTSFPDRPVAFFDHTHNLALQLLVEMGTPLGGSILLLLLMAYIGLLRQAFRAKTGGLAWMALYTVTLVMVHSLLEYPLWYAYFLLPTAFVWGMGLADGRAAELADQGIGRLRERASVSGARMLWGSLIASLALTFGAVYAVWEYRQITDIYAPAKNNPLSLGERIQQGQDTWFFSHQGDYAAATTSEHPGKDPDAYAALGRATHYLIDARLMITWAKAEAERGDLPKAKFLAQRAREFCRGGKLEGCYPLLKEFFAPCEKPIAKGAKPPFQCLPEPKPKPADADPGIDYVLIRQAQEKAQILQGR